MTVWNNRKNTKRITLLEVQIAISSLRKLTKEKLIVARLSSLELQQLVNPLFAKYHYNTSGNNFAKKNTFHCSKSSTWQVEVSSRGIKREHNGTLIIALRLFSFILNWNYHTVVSIFVMSLLFKFFILMK